MNEHILIALAGIGLIGIVIDPVGALLAVLVFEIIVSGHGQPAFSHTLLTFFKIFATGLGLGAVAGYAQGIALRRHWLPNYLHKVATLSVVFTVFALSNVLAEESGLLAVTVMGMWLANMRGVPVEDILDFKESLSVLLISGLFIILAARVNPAQIPGVPETTRPADHPLFAIDARGRIRPFTVGSDWTPAVGWTVIGLIRPETPKSIEGTA